MNAIITHPRKLLLFTLLSLADLGLTYYLLRCGDGQVYEGNPIADWWLTTFGWAGLVCFKIGAVLLACGLAAGISRYRPALGGKVLTLGCTAVTGVLFYSCALAVQVQEDPDAGIQAQARLLDQRIEINNRFRALVHRLGQDLLHQRRTLAEAVTELANSQRVQNPVWLAFLRERTPGCSDRALLATFLVETALESVREGSARAAEAQARLQAEYQAAFGSEG
jgi:hypothetical protein